MSFQDKVVLVTGASSGIGAAIAIKFAEEGAKVSIVGRNEEKLKKTAARCGNHLLILADVSNDDDARRIIIDTVKHFGKLDILINNAGISPFSPIESPNALQIFDKVMATNLRSVVHLTHLAIPHLKVTKGNIVNISSIAGLRNFSPLTFAYNTSKAGLDQFTRGAALELAASGIRVNTVNPGPVKTDIIENAGADRDREALILERMKKNTPLNHISDPEEIADLVLFLASDKAKSITGSSYVTDNGMLTNPCI